MMQRLDAKAQFVSAAFPSIYGGPAMSGSKTASEYTQSRAMALQRLSLTWNVIKYWWADVMSIAVPMYIRSLQESGTDENFVEKTNSGFVNVWIKQADLEGKIGSISVDTDENLPMTPAALKDVIVQLMGLKDERVADAMFHPNNIPLLTKALGAPDLYIPNSDDREKQVAEFSDLLAGVAVVINKYDNHEIEGEVCRSFLVSPTGTMLRKQNSDGIKMIEEHLEEHISMMGGPPNAEQKPNTPPTMEEPKQELPSNVTQFPGIPVGRQ
jgi:hypothetical protein